MRELGACIGVTGPSGGRLRSVLSETRLSPEAHCFDRKLHFSQLSAGQRDCFYGKEGKVLLLMTACQTLQRPVSVPHNHWDVFMTERDVRSDSMNGGEKVLNSRRGL